MAFTPPYIIPVWREGVLNASQVLLKTTFRVAVRFDAATWISAVAGLVFDAERLFVFYKSTDGGLTWTAFATITFPSGGDAPFYGTVALAGDWTTFSFDEGDAMKIVAPTTADEAGGDIDIVLLATRLGI